MSFGLGIDAASNSHQHHQPVLLVSLDSTQPLQQLDFYRRELVDTGQRGLADCRLSHTPAR